MGARENADADDVDIFLDGGFHDFFGRAVQPGVDDVHARVAQRSRDNLYAPIMAVEADLGHHDADALLEGFHCRPPKKLEIASSSSGESTKLNTEFSIQTLQCRCPGILPCRPYQAYYWTKRGALAARFLAQAGSAAL